jgi:hypothetical protein
MTISFLIKWNMSKDWTMPEMNDSLSTHSNGTDMGAVFTVELPFQTQEALK